MHWKAYAQGYMIQPLFTYRIHLILASKLPQRPPTLLVTELAKHKEGKKSNLNKGNLTQRKKEHKIHRGTFKSHEN